MAVVFVNAPAAFSSIHFCSRMPKKTYERVCSTGQLTRKTSVDNGACQYPSAQQIQTALTEQCRYVLTIQTDPATSGCLFHTHLFVNSFTQFRHVGNDADNSVRSSHFRKRANGKFQHFRV